MMADTATSQWTLERYIRDRYIPQRTVAVNLSNDTARGYLRLAQKVNECFGHEVHLGELDAYAVEQFSRWLLAVKHCSESTTREQRYSLRSILRHWNPAQFPKGEGDKWKAKRVFLEIDEEDGLEGLFINKYLPQRPSIGSPKTIQQYGFIFCRLAEFLDRPSTVGDLTDETIGRYAIWRRDVAKVAAVTINCELQKIRAIWNWLAKKRLVECYPTIGNLPEPERLPKAWSRTQLGSLMAAITKQSYRIGGIPAAEWWTAFHMVAWDSGERSGALRLLTWEMLDCERGCLSVPAPVRKGGRKAMVYHLKPATLAALEAIRSPIRELIFYEGTDRSTFWNRYKRLVLAAGLPYEKGRSGPQKLRRSFATFITAAGGDATKALRHSDPRVTDASYNDLTIINPDPANSLLFDLDSTAHKAGRKRVSETTAKYAGGLRRNDVTGIASVVANEPRADEATLSEALRMAEWL